MNIRCWSCGVQTDGWTLTFIRSVQDGALMAQVCYQCATNLKDPTYDQHGDI